MVPMFSLSSYDRASSTLKATHLQNQVKNAVINPLLKPSGVGGALGGGFGGGRGGVLVGVVLVLLMVPQTLHHSLRGGRLWEDIGLTQMTSWRVKKHRSVPAPDYQNLSELQSFFMMLLRRLDKPRYLCTFLTHPR